MAGRPPLPKDAVMGPCETQNPAGLALVLELGAPISDAHGDSRAPIAMLLETYGRHPREKHECLETLAGRGITFPDTPPMALHRGRIDLLEDRDGFGGHTALFNAVVSYHYYVKSKYAKPKPDRDPFAQLFLDRGANPNVRASLRTRVHDETMHEYRNVTPLEWGEQFHAKELVSIPALRLIAERVGRA